VRRFVKQDEVVQSAGFAVKVYAGVHVAIVVRYQNGSSSMSDGPALSTALSLT
jgi:hypothetical protein